MVEIRLAIPEDIPDLVELRHERALLQRQRLTPNAREFWLSEMSDWLKDENSAVYVAVNKSQIIGYVLGRVESTTSGFLPEHKGIISELVLDLHQYQGGAGRLLVDALRQWFRNGDAEQIFVSVPSRSPVEQAFWRALGAVKWMEILWMK